MSSTASARFSHHRSCRRAKVFMLHSCWIMPVINTNLPASKGWWAWWVSITYSAAGLCSRSLWRCLVNFCDLLVPLVDVDDAPGWMSSRLWLNESGCGLLGKKKSGAECMMGVGLINIRLKWWSLLTAFCVGLLKIPLDCGKKRYYFWKGQLFILICPPVM
jgi:hypothetical protein